MILPFGAVFKQWINTVDKFDLPYYSIEKNKNINDFYKGLKMTLEISNISKHNFERSVQLINKTNQFNLTSRRYTESKLEVFLKSKSQFTFVGRLKDKFGDHGITALAMIKKNENTWIID